MKITQFKKKKKPEVSRMIISKEIIKRYNKSRITANPKILCHAPFQNINFEQNGNATVCCYNREHVLGKYPDNTLQEMWFGEKAEEIREYIRQNNLGHGCKICALQLNSENFSAVHARHFDFQSDHPVKSALKKSVNYIKSGKYANYPRSLEFELSNTCNLECVMCNGYFSSSIRKNVEKLPPLKMLYDDAFVEQLTEFIPHLTDAKFLGGEPFLIPIYYKIWQKIIELNPVCKVHITTNASMINDKAWEILYKMRANIVVSIDSIQPDTYREIRKGTDWKTVSDNMEKLHTYTLRKGTDMNFAVCPMTLNWNEMPDIIRHGIKRRIYVYFNTVMYPEELSLKNVDKSKAQEIITNYENQTYPGNGFFHEYNLRQINDLTNMVKHWHQLS